MKISIKFNRRDAWMGVYWKSTAIYQDKPIHDIYICLIPFFPIRIKYDWRICSKCDHDQHKGARCQHRDHLAMCCTCGKEGTA